MKTATHGGWCSVAVSTMLLVSAVTGWSQTAGPDAGWNARMNALQEERDAQAGVAVSIVFDDSGSMNDNQKLGMAKQAFRTWIEHAPNGYRFGLVALNAGKLVPLARNNRAKILAAVNQLTAAGGTPLAQTIAETAAEIRRRRDAGAVYERQVVVILTDGEDTSQRGVTGVQEEIRGLCVNRVEVIAFGYQNEGTYMRDCATHFYSPENGDDLTRGLNTIGSEIGDTSDVVVDDATRAQMQKLVHPAPDHAAASPLASLTPKPFSPETAAPSPPTGTAWNRRTGGHGWTWVALIVIVVLLSSRRKRR